jgi:hypothetical protein
VTFLSASSRSRTGKQGVRPTEKPVRDQADPFVDSGICPYHAAFDGVGQVPGIGRARGGVVDRIGFDRKPDMPKRADGARHVHGRGDQDPTLSRLGREPVLGKRGVFSRAARTVFDNQPRARHAHLFGEPRGNVGLARFARIDIAAGENQQRIRESGSEQDFGGDAFESPCAVASFGSSENPPPLHQAAIPCDRGFVFVELRRPHGPAIVADSNSSISARSAFSVSTFKSSTWQSNGTGRGQYRKPVVSQFEYSCLDRVAGAGRASMLSVKHWEWKMAKSFVQINEFGLDLEVKNKGLLLDVYEDEKRLGDIRITKTGLTWCNGRAHSGPKRTWRQFIEWMNS